MFCALGRIPVDLTSKLYMTELINFKDQGLKLDYLTLNLPNSGQRISKLALRKLWGQY